MRLNNRHPKSRTVENPPKEVGSATNQCKEPECEGSIITDNKTGEEYCNECGIVEKSIIADRGAEWRNSEGSRSKSRAGSRVTQLRHDQGIGSEISHKDRGGYGGTIEGQRKVAMSRQRVLNSQAKSGSRKERTLKKGLVEIKRMGSALGVPESVQEIAAVMFRRTQKKDLLVGRSIEGVSSASIYAACRLESLSRSIREVEEVSRVDEQEIASVYLALNRKLELKVPPASPKEYTGRMASTLNLDREFKSDANRLIDHCEEDEFIIGRSPSTTAAGALYATMLKHGHECNQQVIADELDTTTNTLRKITKYILTVDPELNHHDCDFTKMRIEQIKEALE